MYKYYGFGLRIHSDMEIPEFVPANFETPDLIIKSGRTPENIQDAPLLSRKFFELGKSEFLLNVNNVAKYYAKDGNTVIYETQDGTDERSTRLFLLGSVMAAILYQRKQIPMHASAILHEGKLILFMADSGGGKSTTVAGLAKKGFRIFTDDICVLSNDDNSVVKGLASYPMVKLWENAIDLFEAGSYKKDYKIRPHLPKYGHFFHDEFETNPYPISKIFVLKPLFDKNEVKCRLLSGVEAFKAVERHAYKYRFITGDSLRPQYFSFVSEITRQIPVYELSRPIETNTVDRMTELVLEHI